MGVLLACLLLVVLAMSCDVAESVNEIPDVIGDTPALREHTAQASIENGELGLEEIISNGKTLFIASFNTLDGAGRPETTDTSQSNFRRPRVFP